MWRNTIGDRVLFHGGKLGELSRACSFMFLYDCVFQTRILLTLGSKKGYHRESDHLLQGSQEGKCSE
jgi:hypothetical protein